MLSFPGGLSPTRRLRLRFSTTSSISGEFRALRLRARSAWKQKKNNKNWSTHWSGLLGGRLPLYWRMLVWVVVVSVSVGQSEYHSHNVIRMVHTHAKQYLQSTERLISRKMAHALSLTPSHTLVTKCSWTSARDHRAVKTLPVHWSTWLWRLAWRRRCDCWSTDNKSAAR